MSAKELAAATAQFNAALPDDYGQPLSPEEQAQWDQVKRKRGRPRKGKGAVNVLISLEKGLLEAADSFARERGMGRSALIAECLRKVIVTPSARNSIARRIAG